MLSEKEKLFLQSLSVSALKQLHDKAEAQKSLTDYELQYVWNTAMTKQREQRQKEHDRKKAAKRMKRKRP